MNITNQERNTILAALRCWQERGMTDMRNRSADLDDIATNGGAEDALDDDEIDALCEKLNLGDE